MTHIFLVAFGAFFGGIARYLISKYFNKGNIPWGTLVVNLIGSFLLGLIYGSGISQAWALLLGTGFMGSFTTFSTFKMEHVEFVLR